MQHETQFETALTSTQADNIAGKNQTNPTTTTTGNNTIAADALTSAAVTDFVNTVKGYADITINSNPASPASFSSIGSTCASTPSSTSCWGTAAQPKIVYIKGRRTPRRCSTALSLSATAPAPGS